MTVSSRTQQIRKPTQLAADKTLLRMILAKSPTLTLEVFESPGPSLHLWLEHRGLGKNYYFLMDTGKSYLQ